MRMEAIGGKEPELLDEKEEQTEFDNNSNRNTMSSPCVDPQNSRFFRPTIFTKGDRKEVGTITILRRFQLLLKL